MTKRTDVHRPSTIDPDQYLYVAAITRGDPISLVDATFRRAQLKVLKAHKEMTGGCDSKHEHGGNCHVCGAHCIDFAVFYHEPTNTYVRVGFDCAEKLGGGDPAAFKAIRDERRALEAAKAGKLKAQGILRERGTLERLEPLFVDGSIAKPIDGEDRLQGLDRDLEDRGEQMLGTIKDIVSKLIRYGDLSDRQFAFLDMLLDKFDHLPELQAKRDAERAQAEPAPNGRMVITGKVISIKTIDSDWGVTVKMLVAEDRQFKVWVTVPASIDNITKGDRVELTVTLTPSEDDPTFAIGKRPAKGRVLGD